MLQVAPPLEDKNPLEAISAISRSVAGNLDGLIKRCGEFAVNEGSPRSTRAMQRLLYEASFGDPVYLKARKAAELVASSATSREQDVLDEQEASSFRAISDVTRQVKETLDRLQGESWASGVILTADAEDLEQEHGSTLEGPHPQSRATSSRVPTARPPDASETKDATGAQTAYLTEVVGSSPRSAGSAGERLSSAGSHCSLARAVVLDASMELRAKATPAASSTAGVEGGAGASRKLAGPQADIGGDAMRLKSTISVGGRSLMELDIPRLQSAFKRFQVPDSADIHKGDLYELLRYLGHVMLDENGIGPLVLEVTQYEYLDFDEFQCFMEKYIPYEMAQFQVVFERFDTDKSGEICVMELKNLLAELRFMPMKGMLREALDAVDLDSSGSLGFDELVLFLKTYRQAEGFSTDEVEQLLASFKRFSGEVQGQSDVLAVSNLPDALIAVFGLHIKDIVEDMAERLGPGRGSTPSRGRGFKALYFSEFLIFARKVREGVYEKLQQEYPSWAPGGHGEAQGCMANKQAHFDALDLDKSGGISESELRLALRRLGYTPLRQNVLEVISEVTEGEWKDGRELDFAEFFAFMLVVRQREGFSKDAVEDMRQVFNRFDEDDSGEVDSLELAELFRHLGYKVVLDEIHVYVTEVDANNSGQLDFREFLRLMRLYRETELKRYANVFNARKDRHATSSTKDGTAVEHSGRLPRDQVLNALQDLDMVPTRALDAMGDVALPTNGLNFDTFVGVLDSCRMEMVQTQRKNASFSTERIQHFRDLFARFDKDGSGDIDASELVSILRLFQWQPKTPQEQADLMKKLDTARKRAREAGIEDVGEDGSSSITFWAFVQLARLLETEREKAEEDRVNALVVELDFSQEEVDQFRQIFCERKRLSSEGDDSAPRQGDPEDVTGLNRDAVRKIMRSLVTTIPPADKAKLDGRLNDLMVDDKLDFPNFLRFMRWLLDVDFAGLSSRLASRAAHSTTASGRGPVKGA